MNDGDAILGAIRESPGDDAPRLAYADWLDANGDPDRAEFIRVQIERVRIGVPHIVIAEECAVTPRYGPNYFSISGGEKTNLGGTLGTHAGLKVGRRIDILKPLFRKPMYGLRVHKIDLPFEIVIVRDAQSKPWDHQEFDRLVRRERELLKRWIGAWVGDLPESIMLMDCPDSEYHTIDNETGSWECGTCDGTGQVINEDAVSFGRGFIEEIDCTLVDWMAHGPKIVSQNPVQEVWISDKRPLANGNQWLWEPGFATRHEYQLPLAITNPGGRDTWNGSFTNSLMVYRFDTLEQAMKALSDNCILFAKSLGSRSGDYIPR